MISEVLDFFTMENYVDSIQIIVKLTYNGNTLTVMGLLHYSDVFSFLFLEKNRIEANMILFHLFPTEKVQQEQEKILR